MLEDICKLCDHAWRKHYPMSGCLDKGNNHSRYDYEDGRGRCYCTGTKGPNGEILLSDGHGSIVVGAPNAS